MAIDTNKVIKRNSTGVADLIRDFWQSFIQEKIYNQSIVRNLPNSVRYISAFGDGNSNVYEWNVSEGIQNPAFDVVDADIELSQSEYQTSAGSVTAAMKGSYVSYREDVLADQVQFIGTDITRSLVEEMAGIENTQLFTLLTAADEATGIAAADAVDLTLETLHLGVTYLDELNHETQYIIMDPRAAHQLQPELAQADSTGDNQFLRKNVVGMLYNAMVIKSNYATANEVYFLGPEAIVHYERMPYSVEIGRNSNINLTIEFTIRARFGMATYRSSALAKGVFTYA